MHCKFLTLYPQVSVALISHWISLIFGSRWRPLGEITIGQNAENNWSEVPNFYCYIYNTTPTSKGQEMPWKEEPEDQDICNKMELSICDRENEPIRSQKYGCLKKIWKMTISWHAIIDGRIHARLLPPVKSYKQLITTEWLKSFLIYCSVLRVWP